MNRLAIEALDVDAFAEFGAVIASSAARQAFAINQGTTQRFHALAIAEVMGGQVAISMARALPCTLPFTVAMLERHPLGSQAFIPLNGTRYLIVVAKNPDTPPRAFLADQGQGVQYHRGTWHHPLLALDQGGDFLIVDRVGEGNNCEEVQLAHTWLLSAGVNGT